MAGQPADRPEAARWPSRLMGINPLIDPTSGAEIRRVGRRKPRCTEIGSLQPRNSCEPATNTHQLRGALTSARCIIHGMRFSSDPFIHTMKFLRYLQTNPQLSLAAADCSFCLHELNCTSCVCMLAIMRATVRV